MCPSNKMIRMKSIRILHILPEAVSDSPPGINWCGEWDVLSLKASEIGPKLEEAVFDIIVDSGVSDLLLSLYYGNEKQSDRLLEGVPTKAKVLVDLSCVEIESKDISIDQDHWDQLGKQLAWRFCALDRPVWVRFCNGNLDQNASILLESLQHWTGPGLFLIRADDLNSAALTVLES